MPKGWPPAPPTAPFEALVFADASNSLTNKPSGLDWLAGGWASDCITCSKRSRMGSYGAGM